MTRLRAPIFVFRRPSLRRLIQTVELLLGLAGVGSAAPLLMAQEVYFEDQLLYPTWLTEPQFLGSSVACSAGTAVFGAALDGAEDKSGGLVTFDWDGKRWRQRQRIIVPDGKTWDGFGYAVDLSGDVLIAGAWLNDEAGVDAGAAYVFRRIGDRWALEQKLIPDEIGSSSTFGESVAVDGDVIAVGASRFEGMGGVFLYRFDGINWGLEQILVGSNTSEGDFFGDSVALEGNRLLVGAPVAGNKNQGLVYYFEYVNGVWVQQQKLKSAIEDLSDVGSPLAMSGNLAAFASDGPNGLSCESPGAVHVFRFDDSAWVEETMLVPEGDDCGLFGWGVECSSDRVIVAAPTMDNNEGSVFVYQVAGGDWAVERILKSDGATDDASLGWNALALDGDRLLVGFPNADIVIGAGGCGKFYDLSSGFPLNAEPEEAFPGGGVSVGLSGGEVGAPVLITLEELDWRPFSLPVVAGVFNQFGTFIFSGSIPQIAPGHRFQFRAYTRKEGLLIWSSVDDVLVVEP